MTDINKEKLEILKQTKCANCIRCGKECTRNEVYCEVVFTKENIAKEEDKIPQD